MASAAGTKAVPLSSELLERCESLKVVETLRSKIEKTREKKATQSSKTADDKNK